MKYPVERSVILMLLVLAIGISSPLYSQQYTTAQIQHAQNKLQEWGILDYLVRQSSQDEQQVTTRADVLVACYEIMKELKRVETSIGQNSNALNSIRQNMSELASRPVQEGLTTSEDRLIENVTNQVFANMKHMPEIRDLQKDVVEIKSEMKREETGSNVQDDVNDQIRSLNQKANRATIIAVVSAGVASVIAVLAAE